MLKKSFLLGTSIIVAAGIAAPAMAQVTDEIIVTATKRQTTLQATPVAVTVTSSDTIEKAQILDIRDLQSVVPSLRVGQLQNSADTNFFIRGFGNGANNAGIEPSVGVFVDGVYRSRSAAQIGDLPKLERIEVLKGPQSTLFGKNASAGVISVVTAKPSYTPNGYVEATYGNYDQKILKGYVTGGLSDDFAVSLGAGLNKRDGYADTFIDGLSPVGDRNRFNVRGQALYEPTDTVSFRLIGDYSSLDEVCCLVTNVQNGAAAAGIAALGGATAPEADPFSYVSFENRDPENDISDYGVSFHADVDLDNFTITSISSYRKNDRFNLQAADFNTLDLLESVTTDNQLKTFSQELRLTSTWDKNFDWMLGGYLFVEDVDGAAGLEYGEQLNDFFNVLLEAGSGLAGLLDLTQGLYVDENGNPFPAETFLGGNVETDERFTQYNEAWSIFGTVDYNVTDRLTLTGGLNYTKDRKSVTARTTNNDIWSNIDLGQYDADGNPIPGAGTPTVFGDSLAVIGPGLIPLLVPGTSAAEAEVLSRVLVGALQSTQFQPQFLDFPNVVEDGRSSDDKLTYIARIAYEVNDSINVYGSYGTGFKATSWNLARDSRPFLSDRAALETNGLAQNNQVYRTRFAGPEEATVIEFGLKAKFDNGNVNIAVFDQAIKDFQANPFLGTGFTLLNAGEQSTKGVEIDGTYRFGDLTLSGAATYLDAKYDEFTAAQGASIFQFNPTTETYPRVLTDLSGEQVAGIPELAVSLGALYNHDFENGMSGFVRGDWQFESDIQIDDRYLEGSIPDNDLENRKISTFNASAGLDFDNGLALQVWGRNLFNDEYISTLFPGVAQDGVVNGYPSQPRTYGASLRYSFD